MATLPVRTPSQHSHSSGSGRFSTSLSTELAKCLQLVVPASMTADDRAAWIMAAVDGLEDIRADEVAAISAEVRRTVTRPSHIVPEIARLVAEKRSSSSKQQRWGTPLPELPPRKPGPPLDADEIAAMPQWMRSMGLRVGFLKRRDDGTLVDSARA